MEHGMSRRSFLVGIPALACAGALGSVARARGATDPPPTSLHAGYPRLDLVQVQALVGVSHRDLAQVRRLVEAQPSLARASWDWGFGDWETGLGAAAHTGGREIAHLLLEHGAHPTIFSSTMLGQLDVVKALVSASPGIQRTLGPHGLTLMHHARVGGKDAEPVVAYLESVGDADTRTKTVPLEAADRDAVVGRYSFGAGEGDRFDVDVKDDRLGILKHGGTRMLLFHTGDLVFFPSGVPSVRIAFARASGRVNQLTVADPEVYLTARREA